MNTLFHFIQRRPIQKIVGAASASATTESPFQQNLRDIVARESVSLDDLKSVARNYRSSRDFVREVSGLVHADQILNFMNRAEAILDVDDLTKLAEEIFGPNLETIVSGTDFQNTFRRAADTIVALKVLSLRHDQISSLLDLLRGVDLLWRVAASDPTLAQPHAIRRALKATVVLPGDVFPIPVAPQKREEVPSKKKPAETKSQKALEVANNLEYALREILRVSSSDLEAPPQQKESKTQTSTPKGAIPVSSQPPRLNANAIQRLSSRTKTALDSIGIDLRTTPLIDVINRTRHALNARIADIDWMEIDYVRGDLYAPAPFRPGAEAAVPLPLPKTHGKIHPAGMGDLIVVRQQIKQYEMGEIAHIENVLKSESKKRTHIRREYLETTTLVETEAETEREQDQQFTERSEMERETTKTIQEEDNLKAGATISASYGPFVQFEGSVEYETQDATEESTRQASRYAREIVERSAQRISERVRKEQFRKVINEIEETNRHGFDNTAGEGHVIGIYQWVDKIYEVQAFKYEQRLLFDVMIPEPGVFLAQALQDSLPEGVLPPKPQEFCDAADQIGEVNYLRLAHQYGATVSPPPQDLITVVKPFQHVAQSSGGEPTSFAEAAAIEIEPGYRVLSALKRDAKIDSDSEGGYLDSWVGSVSPTDVEAILSGGSVTYDEVDQIAAGVVTNNLSALALTYEITCGPTYRAYEKWQIETHDAIMQAYLNRKTAYDQALAALLAEKGTEIVGRNPAENRKLERDELKKFMLSMLGIHLNRDKLSSIAYSDQLNSITISATLTSADRRHDIVG